MHEAVFGNLVASGVLAVGDGYRAKLAELGDGGPLFLRAGALTEHGFVWDGLESFVQEAPIATKRGKPQDVVITTKGNSIGRVGWVPGDAPDFVYSPHLSYWRSLDPGSIAPRYLYYWSKSDRFVAQLRNVAYGTDMAPYLSLRDQLRLRIRLPGIAEQRAIAEVLGALDDKIAANDQVVRLCDDMSRVRYKRATPEGDEVPLSKLARFVNGRAFTKDATGTGRVVIRIAELNSGLSGSTVYTDLDVPEDHLAGPGGLLFAWSGSLTVARWYRPVAIVNQHIFKVIPNDGYHMWLVNQALRTKLDEFRAIAADKATTMGHIQRRHLDEAVRIPCASTSERLNALMTGLWDRALAAEEENLELVRTRDELLPLLMSGKLRVKDAERVVGDAV